MLWGSGFCWFVSFSLVFGVLFCSFWHWCTLVFSEIPSYVVWSQKSIWGNSHSYCWNSTLLFLFFWLPLTCMLHSCGSIVLGFLVYNLLLTSSLYSLALIGSLYFHTLRFRTTFLNIKVTNKPSKDILHYSGFGVSVSLPICYCMSIFSIKTLSI